MTKITPIIPDPLAAGRRIAIIWSTDDVLTVRPDLTDDQAWEVLRAVEDAHDANHGICWDTLEAAAVTLFPEPLSSPQRKD
jgi:hypothetical protein